MAHCLTLVAVGDRSSNKTELLMRYTGQETSQFGFKSRLEEVIVDGRRYLVRFVDAECDDDYSALRRSEIEEANCVLLCYSVVRRSSFESLRTKWCLEIREHDINLPIVLVGTDVEKRNDSASHVSSGEAENFGRLIGAFAFVECSVESFVGVDDVFIGAIRSVSSRYCRLRPLIKMK